MATPPPSQFAALLRQSKFSSFDPKIAQVYASYGGHAHRGNWGLKRPLPLRRRKGTVTVRAVDSREQQTEWKSAEPQSRWIKMWEEVGIRPRLAEWGPWQEKLGPLGQVQWDLDSEFGLTTREPAQPPPPERADEKGDEEVWRLQSMAVPNIEAMSDSQFERYLQKLREMRPAFREWLEKATEDDTNVSGQPVSLWKQSRMVGDYYKGFLQNQAALQYTDKTSRVIEQQPQRYGGLTYTQSSYLQSFLITEPSHGRIVHRSDPTNNRGVSSRIPEDYVVGFAGMTSSLNKHSKGAQDAIQWESLVRDGTRELGQGVTKFRLMKAELAGTPRTVGENVEGLKSVLLHTEVWADEGENHSRAHYEKPGSREYVGKEDQILEASFSMLRPVPPKRPAYNGAPTGNAKDKLLDILKLITPRNAEQL